MIILPFNPTKIDPVNAYAKPDPATWPAAYPKNYLILNDYKLPNGITIKIPYAVGTGGGTKVFVNYHPATFRQLIKNTGLMPSGFGPAEVLIHEMTHGFRMMCGELRGSDLVTGNPDMDDIEEFYAILVANVYGSERGRTLMRASHRGSDAAPLKAGLSNSEAYYEAYDTEIDAWFTEQRNFCMDMARIQTKFNPFRAAAITRGLMAGSITPMAL
jgi:hypothetical protein